MASTSQNEALREAVERQMEYIKRLEAENEVFRRNSPDNVRSATSSASSTGSATNRLSRTAPRAADRPAAQVTGPLRRYETGTDPAHPTATSVSQATDRFNGNSSLASQLPGLAECVSRMSDREAAEILTGLAARSPQASPPNPARITPEVPQPVDVARVPSFGSNYTAVPVSSGVLTPNRTSPCNIQSAEDAAALALGRMMLSPQAQFGFSPTGMQQTTSQSAANAELINSQPLLGSQRGGNGNPIYSASVSPRITSSYNGNSYLLTDRIESNGDTMRESQNGRENAAAGKRSSPEVERSHCRVNNFVRDANSYEHVSHDKCADGFCDGSRSRYSPTDRTGSRSVRSRDYSRDVGQQHVGSNDDSVQQHAPDASSEVHTGSTSPNRHRCRSYFESSEPEVDEVTTAPLRRQSCHQHRATGPADDSSERDSNAPRSNGTERDKKEERRGLATPTGQQRRHSRHRQSTSGGGGDPGDDGSDDERSSNGSNGAGSSDDGGRGQKNSNRDDVSPERSPRRSTRKRRTTAQRQSSPAGTVSLSPQDLDNVIKNAVEQALKQSPVSPMAATVAAQPDDNSAKFSRPLQSDREESTRRHPSSLSKRQRSTQGRDTDRRKGQRPSDRDSSNRSDRTHRQPRNGGGGDDSSSSDDTTSNHSGDGNRDCRDRNSGRRSSSPGDSPTRSRAVTAKGQSRWVRPDRFDGTTSLETFLVKFENCAEFNQWTEKEKLAHLWASLQKEAAQLLWGAHELSYEELVDKLRKRFGSRGMEERFQTELRCRRRKRDETIRELAQDIRRLLTLAYPGEQSRVIEHIGRDAFLAALDDPEFELKIRERDPSDLDTAVCLAQRFEISRGVVSASSGPTRQRAARQITEEPAMTRATETPYPPDVEAMMTSVAERVLAQVKGSNASVLAYEGPPSRTPPPFQAGKDRQPGNEKRKGGNGLKAKKFARAVERNGSAASGHSTDTAMTAADTQQLQDMQTELTKMATEKGKLLAERERLAKELSQLKGRQNTPTATPVQPEQKKEARFYHRSNNGNFFDPNQSYGSPNQNFGAQAQGANNELNNPQRRCWVCDGLGHFARNCPQGQRPTQYAQQGQSAQINGTIRCNSMGKSDHACYLKAEVNGSGCECLLDSGSEVTVLPYGLVKGCQLKPTNQTLKAANGSAIPVLGEVTASIATSKFRSTVTGLVTDHVVEAMLGINWLCDNAAEWSFAGAFITLGGQRHDLIVRSRANKWCRRVVLREDVEVPPRSQVDLPCKVIFRGREWDPSQVQSPETFSEVCWGTRPTPLGPGVYVARTITPEDKFDNVPVRVMNVQQRPRLIRAGTTVSDLEVLTPVSCPSPRFEAAGSGLTEGEETCVKTMSLFPAQDGRNPEGIRDFHNAREIESAKSHLGIATQGKPVSSSVTQDEGVPGYIEKLIEGVDAATPESATIGLQELLLSNRHVFSESENDLGRTDVVVHHRGVEAYPTATQALSTCARRSHFGACGHHACTGRNRTGIEPLGFERCVG